MTITATELKNNLGKYLILAPLKIFLLPKTVKQLPNSHLPIKTN